LWWACSFVVVLIVGVLAVMQSAIICVTIEHADCYVPVLPFALVIGSMFGHASSVFAFD
jgi:hypothetical protein